ncbi:MAG: hypothetical protein LBM75_02295 [Myxococcales bacterium]|jgi:putative membrane protein|nr:hypothetical protein [Myxococcales bacterium]
MSQRHFLQDGAKARTKEVIEAIELQTSAEIVVSVRVRADDYRVAAYRFAFFAMALAILILLLIPQTFAPEVIALEAMGALFAALALATFASPLLRLLVRPEQLARKSRTLAHALFHELGISRTSGRNGILVFVSLFERQCLVIPDIGVDESLLGEPWKEVQAELSAAVQRLDFEAFSAALQRMGPILGAVMPRAEDDINELADEVC